MNLDITALYESWATPCDKTQLIMLLHLILVILLIILFSVK